MGHKATHLPALTGARFLAAFWVFLFHVHLRTPLYFLPWQARNVVSQGALGVNFFFVLSGFLLTYAHLKDFKPIKLNGFYYYKWFMFTRITRIYPVYIAGLFLSLIVSFLIKELPDKSIVILNVLMIESYIWPIAQEWYGGGAWSVSVELFFYMLLPFILPLLLAINNKVLLYLLIILMSVVGAFPGLLFQLFPSSISFQLQYCFPPLRLAEFVSGIATALLVFRYHVKIPVWAFIFGLCLFCVWVMYLFQDLNGFVVHNIILIPLLSMFLAVISKPTMPWFLRWIGNRFMVYMGKVSYSFYIAQLPIFIFIDVFMKRNNLKYSSLHMLIGLFVANIILSLFLYEFVEKNHP